MKKALFILMTFVALIGFHNQASAQYFGVGVNVPSLLTGTVNVSLEAAIAPHWSLDIPLY